MATKPQKPTIEEKSVRKKPDGRKNNGGARPGTGGAMPGAGRPAHAPTHPRTSTHPMHGTHATHATHATRPRTHA